MLLLHGAIWLHRCHASVRTYHFRFVVQHWCANILELSYNIVNLAYTTTSGPFRFCHDVTAHWTGSKASS